MAAFSTKAPRIGGVPKVPQPRAVTGENVRFQKSVRPPTRFPHISVSRRDYSKPEMAAEQGPSEGTLSTGNTGFTGET
jgi:hypothetical protein